MGPGAGYHGRVKIDVFAEDRLEQMQEAWVFGEACGCGWDGGGGAEREFGGGRVGWEERENLPFGGWEYVLGRKKSVGWGGGEGIGDGTMCGLFGSVDTGLKITGLPRTREPELWRRRALRRMENIGDYLEMFTIRLAGGDIYMYIYRQLGSIGESHSNANIGDVKPTAG